MGLITRVIQRSAVDCAGIQAALIAAGFQFSQLSCECGVSPLVRITSQDSDQDPTAFVLSYVDPGAIKVVSDKAAGPDGVPEAASDGVDKHVLTLSKVLFGTSTPAQGNEQLKISPSSMILVTPSKPTLVGGVVTAEVGPSLLSGEVIVYVTGVAGKMFGGALKVRFV